MEQNTKKQERQLEVIFLLAVFLTILMWALVQPFNVSPDEAMRYQIVDYIMRHGKLPVGYDAEIRDPNWGISYAFYPITTYIAGAVFGKIATLFSSSGMAPIYGARLVNVIFGTITAGLNLKIGKMLFEKRMAWFYTILICFLPGTIFFNSYVNMDALGLCASSWIVLCWCKAVKNDWSVKLCVELGVAISLCALSYFNAYGYILCSILFFCTTMLLCGRKKWDVKRMIQLGLVVMAVVAVLAGWWFIRNAILYCLILTQTRTIVREKSATVNVCSTGIHKRYEDSSETDGYDHMGYVHVDSGRMAVQLAGDGTGQLYRCFWLYECILGKDLV